MEKRIELEKRGRQPEEIEDLNLDNCRSTQIAGLTDEFKNLVSLSLNNVGLTTLKGFPNLPKLERLELSDNRISGSLNLLNGCPKLISLNLSGNKIGTLEALEPLKELKELTILDLFNCEVTSVDGYREKVFAMFDNLEFLDNCDKNNIAYDSEDEEDDDDSEDGVDGLDKEEGSEDDDDVEENGEIEDGEDDDIDEEEDDDLNEDDDLDDEENDDDLDEDGDEDDDESEPVSKGKKRKHEEEEEDDA